MSEPDVEAIVNAAAAEARRRAPGPAVAPEAPVAVAVDAAACVPNPFVDPVTGESLADAGQLSRGA